MRSLVILSAIALSSGAPSLALAQRVVLLPADDAAREVPPDLLAALADALPAGAVEDATLARMIDEGLSREVVLVGADAVSTLVDAVHELEALVATRQREAALRQAQLVRELSQGTVDALAGQSALARTVFAGCLAEAWLHLQLHEPQVARDGLLACRQGYPDVAIDTPTTAPPLVTLLADVDAELASRPSHTLTIDGAPSGCQVLLNGRVLAITPSAIPGVPAGRYHLQLVCPLMDHTRVHTVVMPAADRVVAIDPAFDQALRTTPHVRLSFGSSTGTDTERVQYAIRLVALAGATEAFIVTTALGGVRVDRVTLGEGMVASAAFSDASQVGAAVQALMDRRTVDLRSGRAQISSEPVPREVAPSSGPGPDVALILGASAGGIGLVGLAAGFVELSVWYEHGHERSVLGDPRLLRVIQLRQLQDYDFGVATALGIGGAWLTAVTVPLWLPPEREVPWWSWALGGAGLVALGVGVGLIATDGQTSRSPNFATCNCLDVQESLLEGILIANASAPLLSVPITHLFRLVTGPTAPAVRLDAGAEHAGVSIGGVW